jgi:hypothetical protein
MLLRAAALGSVLVLAAACGGTKAEPKSNLPPGCSAAESQAIVTTFLTAPSVAPPEMFRFYRTRESDGRRYSTTSGPAAVAHAKARLALRERDRLLSLRVDPVDINHVKFAFTLTRTAPDFARRKITARIANGTGTLDCAHGLVASWTLLGP